MSAPGRSPRRVLLADTARALAGAGIDAAWAEAQLLLAAALGVERGRLLAGDDVDPAARARLEPLLARRLRREPLQHVLGTAPFRWIDLAVGPGVFVPRPETELVVDLAARELAAADVVVDLCSGSGALALAVAHEYPRARVTAVERSEAALRWLRRNVDAAGGRVEVVEADVAGWRPADLLARVDVVVANPPYVPSATPVSPEVRADPAEAVFAGDDGLALMPALAATAAALLRPGGRLVAEHDETHADAVRAIVAAAGFAAVRTEDDLSGRPRFVTALAADRGPGAAGWGPVEVDTWE